MKNPIIYIVDDEPGMRRSLQLLLESANYDVRSFPSAEEFRAEFHGEEPACLILDVCLDGGVSGLELQQQLSSGHVFLPIIMMSANGNAPNIVQAMQLGAVTFLEKPFSDDAMLACVHEALAWDTSGPHSPYEVRQRIKSLTPREHEVMSCLLLGANTKAIAYNFGISLQTVDKHRQRTFEKLRVESSHDLVRVVARARSTSWSQPFGESVS